MVDVTPVGAGDDIPDDWTIGRLTIGRLAVIVSDEVYGPCRTFESEWMLAKPNMVVFESVAGDGERTQSGVRQFAETTRRQRQSVGNHAPGITALHECSADLSQVLTHERFTAGDDDEHFVGVDVWSYFRIQNMEKILCGHVGRLYGCHTIAATMEAMNITT